VPQTSIGREIDIKGASHGGKKPPEQKMNIEKMSKLVKRNVLSLFHEKPYKDTFKKEREIWHIMNMTQRRAFNCFTHPTYK
jgi:hypothetical protein